MQCGGVEGIFILKRAWRRQMDLVLRRRVIGLVTAVGENLHAHTVGKLSDQLILRYIRILCDLKLRHAFDIVGVEDRSISCGERKLLFTSAVSQFLTVLLPGESLLFGVVIRIPVLNVGCLRSFFQVPFLVGMVLSVVIHDLDHRHPSGIVIALHHGDKGEPEGVAASVVGLGDSVVRSTAALTAPFLSPFQSFFLKNMGESVGELSAVFLFIHRSAHRRSPPILQV